MRGKKKGGREGNSAIRKDQNRIAQRAFRVRQKAYYVALEKEVLERSGEIRDATKRYQLLSEAADRLQQENIALKAALAPKHGIGPMHVDFPTQQLAGPGFPSPKLVRNSIGFDATFHPQSPSQVLLCETDVDDHDVLYSVHDFTILATQRDHMAVDTDIGLTTGLPSIDRGAKGHHFEQPSIPIPTHGEGLSDIHRPLEPCPVDPAVNHGQPPQIEIRPELLSPSKFHDKSHDGSRSHAPPHHDESGPPGSQTQANHAEAQNPQVMATTAWSTNGVKLSIAAGALIYREALGRHHASALASDMNSCGVFVTPGEDEKALPPIGLSQSSTIRASCEQPLYASSSTTCLPRVIRNQSYGSHSQQLHQLRDDSLGQLGTPLEGQRNAPTCATMTHGVETVYHSGSEEAKQAAPQHFALQISLPTRPSSNARRSHCSRALRLEADGDAMPFIGSLTPTDRLSPSGNDQHFHPYRDIATSFQAYEEHFFSACRS